MATTCQAVVFLGDGRYEMRVFAIPGPPPGGCLLKVEAVGLCGSDLAQLRGVELVPGGTAFPVVPGHEIVGRVVERSPDCTLNVVEGDRVAVDELYRLEPPLRFYGYSDMTGHGEVGLWGGYGEYMQIFPGTRLYKMGLSKPAEELTLFEPLANAVHWTDLAGVREGDVVVIEGPGHQGLAVLQAVLTKKPSMVIQTGVTSDASRLQVATQIGASRTIMVDAEDPVAVVRDLTDGRMADVVMDIASVTASVPLALDLVRQRGMVLLAGVKDQQAVPNLVTDWIVLKALTIVGGMGFTPETMERAVDLIETGQVDSQLLVGDVLGLDSIDRAMRLLARTEPGYDALRVNLKMA